MQILTYLLILLFASVLKAQNSSTNIAGESTGAPAVIDENQTDSKIQNKYGLFYKHGTGVPQDYTRAVYWFQKSADQGDPTGEVSLASMYLGGKGVPRDVDTATAWLKKAAAQDYSTAVEMLIKINQHKGIGEAQTNIQTSNSQTNNPTPLNNKGSVGILATDIKIPTFDEKTRLQTGVLEIKAGENVTIFDIDNDFVILAKGDSTRVKEPVSVLTPESIQSIKEEVKVQPSAANVTSSIQPIRENTVVNYKEGEKTVITKTGHPEDYKFPDGASVSVLRLYKRVNPEEDSVNVLEAGKTIHLPKQLLDQASFAQSFPEEAQAEASNKQKEQEKEEAAKIVPVKPEVVSVTPTTSRLIGSKQTKGEIEYMIGDFFQTHTPTFYSVDPVERGHPEWKGLQGISGDFCQWMHSIKQWGDLDHGQYTTNDAIGQYFINRAAPVATETTKFDSPTIVALADALNYLYSKKGVRPIAVSTAFLTWAHDMNKYSDEELRAGKVWDQTQWLTPPKYPEDPTDQTKQNIVERWVNMGYYTTRTTYDLQVKYRSHIDPKFERQVFLYPYGRGQIPLAYSDFRRANLEEAINALIRFGVCTEFEYPKTNLLTSTPPPASIISSAKNRKGLVIRCYNAWDDDNKKNRFQGGHTMMESATNRALKEGPILAKYYQFIAREITAGHPVIITQLVPSNKTVESYFNHSNDLLQNKPGVQVPAYEKYTYLITGTGKTDRLEIQTLKHGKILMEGQPNIGEPKTPLAQLTPAMLVPRWECYSIGLD